MAAAAAAAAAASAVVVVAVMRCWIMESIMSEYCCSIWTIIGFDWPAAAEVTAAAAAAVGSAVAAGVVPVAEEEEEEGEVGEWRGRRLWTTGATHCDRYWSRLARSRSDRLDWSPAPSSARPPPARRRCSDSSCSTDALNDSTASSHDALDNTLQDTQQRTSSIDGFRTDLFGYRVPRLRI